MSRGATGYINRKDNINNNKNWSFKIACLSVVMPVILFEILWNILDIHIWILTKLVLFIKLCDITHCRPQIIAPLQWRHNERDGVSNQIKNTPKLRVIGLCAGNSPMTGEFPSQRASNAENVSIWWHQHAFCSLCLLCSPKYNMLRIAYTAKNSINLFFISFA